jgi:hypothetical protein
MDLDVRKTLTDAGYIAVGIGVLGVQQIQTRTRELQERVTEATAPFGGQADRARQLLADRIDAAQKLAETVQHDVRVRVQPVVAQLEARLADLPEPLNRVAEPVKRVQTLLAA